MQGIPPVFPPIARPPSRGTDGAFRRTNARGAAYPVYRGLPRKKDEKMNIPKPLATSEVGESVRVVSLQSTGRMRRRLADLGLIPGATVACLGRSPLGDPTAYLIRGAVIAIRRRDAMEVLVTTE